MPYTAFRSFKLCKGLYLEERVGATSYKARASLSGKVFTTNTETDDYARAERTALSWFKRLSPDGQSPRDTHTMHAAAKAFLADLSGGKKRDYTSKWSAISDFFIGRDVEDITTPVLKEFLRWRKARKTVKATTTHKDFVTIRRVLHFAVEEGWLAALPVFPKQESREANPRPWLEPDDWETLQRVARQRIEDAPDKRTKRRREDLLDFCLLMVFVCTRVDELRNVRKRDCTVRPPLQQEGLTFSTKGVPLEPQTYLEMRIKGKTGVRVGVAGHDAVDVYERLVARNGLKDDHFLFKEKQRDAFRELLIAAGLRHDEEPRNLKALRCTGLMLKVLKNPRINLKLLADSVGTSISMLSQFYLKPLTVDMNVGELLE